MSRSSDQIQFTAYVHTTLDALLRQELIRLGRTPLKYGLNAGILAFLSLDDSNKRKLLDKAGSLMGVNLNLEGADTQLDVKKTLKELLAD